MRREENRRRAQAGLVQSRINEQTPRSELPATLQRVIPSGRALHFSPAKRHDFSPPFTTGESFNPDAMRAFVQRSLDSRRFAGELSPLVEDLTRAGAVMGSPHFMSPEQAEGRSDDIGPHTDVYGLGATLYKVVTGNPPIVGSDAWETVRNVVTQQPTQPHEINSSLSEDLSLVIMKSLDKNHHRRYAIMEMFSEDLGRILEGRAPLARLNHLRNDQSRVSVFQRFSGVVSTLIFGSNKSLNDSAGTEP